MTERQACRSMQLTRSFVQRHSVGGGARDREHLKRSLFNLNGKHMSR